MNTKKITGMALMSALSIVLLFIPFLRIRPFPIAPFLEYDACDIPIMFATLIYGPSAGVVVTIVVSIIQGLTVSADSGIIGVAMHIIATGSFVISCGLLFKFLKKKNFNQIANLALSTLLGSVCWLVSMIAFNLALTPIFMKVPFERIIQILLPAIIPFNLMKAGINGVIGAILYIPLHKSVEKYLDKPVINEKDIKLYDLKTNEKDNLID